MGEDAPPQQLVVVGSSAGGVEALSILVSTLPADFPAPIVIAQHLDPQRPSHLGEILARRSALPLTTILDREPLVPGHIYVVPADRHVEIRDRQLILRQDADGGRPKPSINRLFSSAARAYGEGLIAVVLTGTGSDGAAGALEVKKAGGTVVIQDPATATYPVMPRSLAPTSVDLVATIEQMGPLLRDLLTNVFEAAPPSEVRTLNGLLRQVHDRTGFDFTNYKPSTIQRRVQRRMVATGSQSLTAYVRYLQRHPEEYPRLISAFLIKVTEFFRDRQLFTALHDKVLPDLIAVARERNYELRLWSAGCATGEEAYSLAIQLADVLGDELDRFTVRIFATDLDAEAIAFARRGIYTPATLAGMPADYVNRYFTRLNGDFEVDKRVRSLVVFGQHDLGQRAPFPRTDLVLCRNVLIYFTTDLQKRVLQLFAYSLRDGGYLVLGKAETTNPVPELFAAVQPALKLYQRQAGPALIPSGPIKDLAPLRPAAKGIVPLPTGGLAPPERPSREVTRGRTLTERLGALVFNLPVGVVVDRRYDIQVINTVAHALLNIYRPATGEDLLHLVEDVPTKPLRALIDAALRGEGPTPDSAVLPLEADGEEPRYLRITTYPQRFEGDEGPVESVLLLITDVTAEERGRHAAGQATSQLGPAEAAEPARERQEELERLRAQLARLMATNQELRDANQELTSVNVELRQAAEESLVNTEEVQAASEEVETLNEELQATNEELETLNEELQATVEELNTTNDDLEARSNELLELAGAREEQAQASEAERARLVSILDCAGDALLAVDMNGTPIYRNQAYTTAFGDAVAGARDEQGRPLTPEALPLARAARGEAFRLAFSVGDGSVQRRYEVHGQPLRSSASVTGGVVVFRDVTDLRRSSAPDAGAAGAGS